MFKQTAPVFDDSEARSCVLGLDVGGTGIKGMVLDHDLRPRGSVRRSTPSAEGPDAVVDAIAAALRTLDEIATGQRLTVRQAGVVVPGIVDEGTQTAVWSANIGWRDLPLAALLGSRTGLPVTLGHDVRAGGAAECGLGAARGARNALFVAIGTGIAAALVCDGELVRSAGYAGELGHVPVPSGRRLCTCGGSGCLETVASAAAIVHAYTERTGRTVSGAADVAALATRGDAVARAVWAQAAKALADALATATTLLAPEVIVLGGGLAEAGPLLLDPVRSGLDERLGFQRRPALLRAELGERAGCFGAGLLGWQAAGRPSASTRTGALAS
ncbi:ROK family protein [Streptomyces sp. NPDC046887]|uniref:ROK family protein n=1 Tax=Streptomyces sp. NPDC046887 TaxID=3155472 RepID=UPI0033D025DB